MKSILSLKELVAYVGGRTCLLVDKIDRTPTKVFTFLLTGAVAQRAPAPDNLKRS